MSKKWMLIAGAAALAVIALVVILFLTNRGPASPDTANIVTGSTTTSGAAGNGSTTTSGAVGTGSTTASGGAISTTTSSTTSPGGSSTTKAPDTVGKYTPIPESKLKATQPTFPPSPGKELAPLMSAPDHTISALVAGSVPDGAQYAIVMRPLGIGPPLSAGSRLVVYVYSVTPTGGAPANTEINRNYVLVLADTANGGGVTKGGSYKAVVTYHYLDGKMVPVLSKAVLVKG